MLDKKYVEDLFENLKINTDKFFEKVSKDVHWTVMGTHPLAGEYLSKEEFVNHTFRRLNKILKEGIILAINNILVDGDYAVVEMKSLSTARNGKPFNNAYCWVVKFNGDIITHVRAYLDSSLVQQLIDENE